MKSSTKKWLTAAGILTVLGVIICFIAFVLSGFDISAFNTHKERTKKDYSISRDGAQNLIIETSNSNVKILKSDSDEIKVSCYESEDISYEIGVQGKDLRITEKDTAKWYNLIFNLNFNETELTVTIPKDNWKDIKVTTSSGDISLDGLNASSVNFDTSSGDIKAENITASSKLSLTATSGDILTANCGIGEAYLKSTSGDVSADKVTSSGDISIKSTSGDVEASDLSVKDELKAESTSGDISITNTVCENRFSSGCTSGDTTLINLSAKTLYAESTSGDIDFSNAAADEYNMESASGDISGTINGNEDTITFVTHTYSGDISVPHPSKGDRIFTASTSSGDIDIKFSR